MSSYFDAIMAQFRDISFLPEEDFLERAVEIETQVIREVSLTTGDKEFPDDLREKIQSCIAVWSYDYEQYASGGHPRERKIPINENAKHWLLTMRYSRMCESLHTLFHEVAVRKIEHRFGGFFSDSPEGFLKVRDSYLAEHGASLHYATEEKPRCPACEAEIPTRPGKPSDG